MQYELSDQSLQLILFALGKRPMEEVWELVANLQQQHQSLSQAAAVPVKAKRKRRKKTEKDHG